MGFLAASPSVAVGASRQQQAIRPPDAVGDVRQPGGGGGFWGKIGGFLKKAAPFAGMALAPFTGGASLGLTGALGTAAKIGIPLATGALGALGAKQAQKSAMARSPEEQQALAGAQGAAGGLTQAGAGLLRSGQATTEEGLAGLEQPSSYWSRLLGGNRASMAQATAAPRASITDIYRGAERGLERSGVRGAQRDVAKSELNRERASKLAGLTTGVQPQAAQQLADLAGTRAQIGAETTRTGASTAGQGASLFANLLGQGAENRQYGRAEGEKSGSSIGGMIFDVLSGVMGGKGKGIMAPNSGNLPSRALPGGGVGRPPPVISGRWQY